MVAVAQREIPFRVYTDGFELFEKAGAPEGQKRRIGGLCTTDALDFQGESIDQDGIDWSYFLKHGWFNDNHAKDQNKVVGYPTAVQRVRKGQRLPNGEVAKSDGHWVEGYLLDNWQPADEIWNLANSLKGTPRRLGFSIEGGVAARDPFARHRVVKAKVKHCAITHVPVNADTGLSILSKALARLNDPQLDDERLETAWEAFAKALAVGDADPSTPPQAGTAQPLARESLEGVEDDEDDEDGVLTFEKALAYVRRRLPQATPALAERIVKLAARRAERRTNV